jgi:hypothetical protein
MPKFFLSPGNHPSTLESRRAPNPKETMRCVAALWLVDPRLGFPAPAQRRLIAPWLSHCPRTPAIRLL